VFPQELAVSRPQAEEPFGALEFTALGWIGAFVGGADKIGDIDPAIRDGGTGVAPVDPGTPDDFRAALPPSRKFFDQARFPPNAIALGTQPLRPVIGPGGRGKNATQQRQDEDIPNLIDHVILPIVWVALRKRGQESFRPCLGHAKGRSKAETTPDNFFALQRLLGLMMKVCGMVFFSFWTASSETWVFVKLSDLRPVNLRR
jgi:hypothetical protein